MNKHRTHRTRIADLSTDGVALTDAQLAALSSGKHVYASDNGDVHKTATININLGVDVDYVTTNSL